MTPLPANPFLNPDALPPCASEAAAPSDPQSSAAAINSIDQRAVFTSSRSPSHGEGYSSCGGHESSVALSDVAHCDSTDPAKRRAGQNNRTQQVAGVAPGPHEAHPGPTIPYGPNLPAEAHPAPASAGLLETDHISEIFFYARKLMKEPVGFVLDEQAFMAEIEEAPLFLRQAG